METVSDAWKAAIYSGHQVYVEVELLATGQIIDVLDGSVTMDSGAATRAQCELTFPASSLLVPVNAEDALTPFGNELQVRRGIRWPDGELELASLGVFVIQDVDVISDQGGASIQVSGLDRSLRAIDAAFESATTYAEGSGYLATILKVIQDGYPGVPYNPDDFQSTDGVTPLLNAEEGGDRWQYALDMAAAIGLDLYFDEDGVLVLRAIPDPAATEREPDDFIVEGESGVVVNPSLTNLTRKWTRADAYNRWIVTGDNPNVDGTPPRGTSTDQTGPTRYEGPMGRKPKFFSSSFISTDDQAQAAADGMKAKERGISQSIDFGSLVNPALQPGDIVRIKRTLPNTSDPQHPLEIVNEDHIIDSLSIPLGIEGGMSGTTRVTRVT